MKIGLIIGRFGDIDGVSLEAQKWIDVLEQMGHRVFIITGTRVRNAANKHLDVKVLPALSFFSPECEWEQTRAFHYPPDDPDQLMSHLERTSTAIAMEMFRWVMNKKIDLLISQNATALPCHLSMGMAIQKMIDHTGLPMLTHDHDFYWERGDRYKTPFLEIEEIKKRSFPLRSNQVKHAVINSHAQKTLKERFDINAELVPNVMDFTENYGQKDDYNRDMHRAFNLDEKDICLYQVTRIVRRKGIETAIDLVKRLDDPRFKLIITGTKADDERFGYYKELLATIENRKLTSQVFFGENRIRYYRTKSATGEKIFSLSDAYSACTASTYFSTYEGFGNAFVECVLAKKPIFVNNYEPVYWPDIGSKGFRTVQIENGKLEDKQVEACKKILLDSALAQEIAEHNFILGKKHFSYQVLQQKLETIFENFGNIHEV